MNKMEKTNQNKINDEPNDSDHADTDVLQKVEIQSEPSIKKPNESQKKEIQHATIQPNDNQNKDPNPTSGVVNPDQSKIEEDEDEDESIIYAIEAIIRILRKFEIILDIKVTKKMIQTWKQKNIPEELNPILDWFATSNNWKDIKKIKEKEEMGLTNKTLVPYLKQLIDQIRIDAKDFSILVKHIDGVLKTILDVVNCGYYYFNSFHKKWDESDYKRSDGKVKFANFFFDFTAIPTSNIVSPTVNIKFRYQLKIVEKDSFEILNYLTYKAKQKYPDMFE